MTEVTAGQATESGGLIFDDPFSLVAAAHELKAPLALVRQLALSLESGMVSSADHDRLLRQMTLTSERALRLVEDLTRATRLEGSLFELEPLNPQQICHDVARQLLPLYKAHGRSIQAVGRKQSLLVVANRELLERVLTSFADNALHYAAEAGESVELRAGSIDGGQKIRLGVRDFGPALPTDVWAKLQQRLGSSVQPIKARPQSSGLGLYIASQFAVAMHGTIGAIRHKDGATFYIDVDSSAQLSLL